jgi:hypothetical protein
MKAAGISVTVLSKRYTTPSGPITAVDTVSLNVQSGASLAPWQRLVALGPFGEGEGRYPLRACASPR